MIQAYIGEGKGKTSAAIGLAVRAAGAGRRVAFIQFDKGHAAGREHYSERAVLRAITSIRLEPTGCERMLPDGTFRFGITAADRAEAERGLRIAHEAISSNDFAVVILDEVLTACTARLLTETEVETLITLHAAQPEQELVLTGQYPDTGRLLSHADLITEMRNVRHYFDKGVAARKGIEY